MVRPEFGGLSLFEIACGKLEKLRFKTEQKYVSIYEDELISIADKYTVSKYIRSRESADADEGLKLIWEWCNHLPYKYYVLFNGCLPFLSVEIIETFIKKFMLSKKDIAFGVKPLRDYVWSSSGSLVIPPEPPKSGIMNTKSKDLIDNQMYIAAHALYAGTIKSLRDNTQLGDFTSKTVELIPLKCSSVELFDIDTEEDFEVCSKLYG